MTPPTNLTARAGRWSAAHRKAAIGGWIAFVVLSVVLGSAAGFKERDDETGIGSSGRADRVLDRAFPPESTETVLIQSGSRTVRDTAFRDTVADVVRRLRAQGASERVELGPASPDRRSRLVTVKLADEERADELLAATRQAQRAHPAFTIGQFGEASLEDGFDEVMGEDMAQAEMFSLPLTLLILLLAFGSFVAALVPLALAISSVAAATGLVSLASHVLVMDDTVNSVVLLIGLAVGIDYSLFYLRREREERAAGRGERAALEAAAATSGRAVLVSGITVMIAMAGMYLAGFSVFTSLATGSIIVVAVTLLASVSVLPAILGALGDRVQRGRFWRRRPERSRLVDAVLGSVLRRPAIAFVAAAAVLVALAIPALSMTTGQPTMASVSDNVEVKATYERIEAAFPGDAQPATAVVRADDVTAPAVQRQIAALGKRLGGHELAVRVSPDRDVAAVEVPIPGRGTDVRARGALTDLRERHIPATLGTLPGVRTDVTGPTAGSMDFAGAMSERGPLVFAFVLSLAFALMLVTFRSVVIAVKAIVLNLLSVGAAYGVLALAYDEPITAWLPMFLFVILFGLSMDYHVFIVSRIREAYDRGMDTTAAVAHGIRATAGVVTSAAAIMVVVFGAFGTVSTIDMQQMGVGLAVAILLDATVVRAVLLPAAMTLLGEWNWWLPRPLRRLPAPEAVS